jgi:hypothetical protein
VSEWAPGCGAAGAEKAASGGQGESPTIAQAAEKRSKNAGAQPSALAPPAPPPPPTRITTRSHPGEGVAVGEGVASVEGDAEGVAPAERVGVAAVPVALREGPGVTEPEGGAVALPLPQKDADEEGAPEAVKEPELDADAEKEGLALPLGEPIGDADAPADAEATPVSEGE